MQKSGAPLKIAVIENDVRCPLSNFSGWLEGAEITTYKPHIDGNLPNINDFDLLIPLGGGQATSDSTKLEWMSEERELIKNAHESGVAIFAICLGAQLLAEALGGTVQHSSLDPGEFGAIEVVRSLEGEADPLFGNDALGTGILNFRSSHNDKITKLPPEAKLLASSPLTEVQAFRAGKSVGVQFHPEVEAKLFESWLETKDIEPGMLAATITIHSKKTSGVDAVSKTLALRLPDVLGN